MLHPPTPAHVPDVQQRRHILVVCCAALALVVSAVASLNIALPAIAADLAASQTDLQWMVDSYALVFAGLLLPAGAVGDRFGRRRVLLTGLVVFGVAYGVAATAGSTGVLIGARAVAGLGAAAIMPVTLSLITTSFPADEREHAVSVWAGVAGGGAILGLLVSGILLELGDWTWVFVVNAGVAAAILAAALRVVSESRDEDGPPLDPIGAVLAALGLTAIIYAVIEAPQHGWLGADTVAGLVAGIGLLTAFVLWELRSRAPMLDPRLFRERAFSSGTLAIALQFFAVFGFLFVVLQYLQFVLGYSPLTAAAAIVPMAMMLVANSRLTAPRLSRRFGPRAVIVAGLSVMACGFVVMSQLGTTSSYWHVLGGLLLIGVGAGLSTAPATTAIVAALPPAKQGVGSAVNDAAREVGGALGIAALGSILANEYAARLAPATRGLSASVSAAAADSIGAVAEAADRLGPRGAQLLADARASFVDGLGLAFAVAAGVLVAAAALVWLLGTHPPAAADRPPAASQPPAGAPGRGVSPHHAVPR